jgi:hypothetical protein
MPFAICRSSSSPPTRRVADRQSSLAAGANAFQPKPLDFERLLPEIAGLLGLTWTQRSTAAPPRDAESAAPLVAPAPDDLEALLHLARIGNMRRIRKHAEHLATLDVRMRPLAARLSSLADGFQSVAIVDLLKTLQEDSLGEGVESQDVSR